MTQSTPSPQIKRKDLTNVKQTCMFLWSAALKPCRCCAKFASLSDPVSAGGKVNLQLVTSYVTVKVVWKKVLKEGFIWEILNFMYTEANTGVNLQFRSGVETRSRQREKKDVERELSSELPLWKHTHQKAPETLLFSFLLCLGQSLVGFLSDEVRIRGLVSLFPTFFTDYMSVLGSNCGVDVDS